MVFKLKCRDESTLKYKAKLESGRAVVYCDCSGTKTELFSLNSGDEVDADYGNIGSGTVYIIVETDGACRNGEMGFNLE